MNSINNKILFLFLKKCSFFLLLLYTSIFVAFPSLAKYLFNLFLLITIFLYIFEKDKSADKVMFFLLACSIFVQVLSWINSLLVFNDIANNYPKIDRLAKLFSFIFIAYILKGEKYKVNTIFCAFLFSMLLGVLLSPNLFVELNNAFLGMRVDFSIKNAQFTSMFSGVGIILLSFLIFLKFSKTSTIKIICFFIFLFFYFFIFLSSQSRQAWLALLVTSFLCPLIIVFFHGQLFSRKLFISYISLFLVFFSLSQTEIVKQRLLNHTLVNERNLISNLMSGDLEKIISRGNGIRVNSWLESIPWIKEHPLVGNGPNSITLVVKQSIKFSKSQKKKIGHLHSFHLEIVLAYGILGALVIYGMYYWLIRSLVLAHRENPELKMYTVLGICFLIFWIIINFFESFSSRSYGVYVHNIMFGCLYTFYFTQQRKKIEEAEECA